MVQMMWIVVVLNVECFTSANIGYIFRYDMWEGREIGTCAAVPRPCTRDSTVLSVVSIVNVKDTLWSLVLML